MERLLTVYNVEILNSLIERDCWRLYTGHLFFIVNWENYIKMININIIKHYYKIAK